MDCELEKSYFLVLHNSLHLLFEDNGNKQQQKEHQQVLDQLYGPEM